MPHPEAAGVVVGIDASNLRAGGGVTFLTETLQAARLTDIARVIVWTGRATSERLPRRREVEIVHEPLLDLSLPVRTLWRQFALPSLVRRAGCAVLFAPGGIVPRLSCATVVYSKNMLPFDRAERARYGYTRARWKLELVRQAQRRSFSHATGVLFLTKHARRKVTAQVPTIQKCAVIPNGIGEDFFRPPRPQRAVGAEPFELLYVSTVSPYKHHESVAIAIARLRDEGLPVRARFIGSGDPLYARSLARLVGTIRRLDPDGSFLRYDGELAYEQIAEAYHRADGYVFASTCENMPIALLEAMAAGLPIACSSREPMPEVLGNAGTYFDPHDVGSIATAIRAVVRDPQLRAVIAARAYKRARQFSWAHCADQVFSFLAAVARGGANAQTD